MNLSRQEQIVLRTLHRLGGWRHIREVWGELPNKGADYNTIDAVAKTLDALVHKGLLVKERRTMEGPRSRFRFAMGLSTAHTLDTPNPQNYWRHFANAFGESLTLGWYCAGGGVLHAFLPGIKRLQFSASSAVIRSFFKLLKSRRHDGEMLENSDQELLAALAAWRTRQGKGPEEDQR